MEVVGVENESLEKKRKRLIFRSAHRGTKEMDVILGEFAQAHVPRFTATELAEYDMILCQNDPDLYNWITGKEKPPASVFNTNAWIWLEEYQQGIRREQLEKVCDEKTSQELVHMACSENNIEDYWTVIYALRRRGSQAEFDLAQRLVLSQNPEYRQAGVHILSQLDYENKDFHEKIIQMFITLLEDNNEGVVEASAHGLGHRQDIRAVPHLLKLVAHDNAGIRHGVVLGLSGHEDTGAIKGLMNLMTDEDYDVRNWATFGLAQQCEMDTDEIREALLARLSEKDYEIRGEALVGLARRKDLRVKEYILAELRGEFNGSYVFEAVEEFPDVDFIPELKRVREIYKGDMRSHHLSYLDDAITACSKLS